MPLGHNYKRQAERKQIVPSYRQQRLQRGICRQQEQAPAAWPLEACPTFTAGGPDPDPAESSSTGLSRIFSNSSSNACPTATCMKQGGWGDVEALVTGTLSLDFQQQLLNCLDPRPPVQGIEIWVVPLSTHPRPSSCPTIEHDSR